MFWPKEIWGRFADSLDDFRVRTTASTDHRRGLTLRTCQCITPLGAWIGLTVVTCGAAFARGNITLQPHILKHRSYCMRVH